MSEKHTPLDQFRIEQIMPFNFEGFNLGLTNSAIAMIAAVVGVTLFMLFGLRKKALVPGRLQNLAEISHEFVHNMLKDQVGEKDGKKFFPFVFTLFMFILFCNLIGLIPYSFTPTSHIIITFTMAITVFLTVIAVGVAKHGFHFLGLFVPAGLPKWMVPMIFPIEIISFLARPVSLSIRLCAAMTAGHILLKVFAGFMVSLFGLSFFGMWWTGPAVGMVLPFPVLIFLIGLEIFVAFLQAYIFSLLTSIYLHDAVHLH